MIYVIFPFRFTHYFLSPFLKGGSNLEYVKIDDVKDEIFLFDNEILPNDGISELCAPAENCHVIIRGGFSDNRIDFGDYFDKIVVP